MSLSTYAAKAVVFLALTAAPIAAHAEDVRATQPHDLSRILSIGGDVTEILYALKLGDKIVAVDTTSLFPAEAASEKLKVGYMRALSAEGVLSVAPSIILASEGAGPPESVNALKSASVPYVEIPNTWSISGISAKVRAVAAATGVTGRGEKLAKSIEARFSLLERTRKRISAPLKVLFVLNASGGRMIVGGAETSADAILRIAGAENAAHSVTGYKPITSEALVAMAPDAIMVMKGGRGGHDASGLRELAAVKATPASSRDMIRDIDGLYLLGFGPRTPDAARDVMTWLYPHLTN